MNVVANFMDNTIVKKVRRSVNVSNICQSYEQMYCGTVFLRQGNLARTCSVAVVIRGRGLFLLFFLLVFVLVVFMDPRGLIDKLCCCCC